MTNQTAVKIQLSGIFGQHGYSDSQSDAVIAEASYNSLRTAIGQKITAALQSGKLLVQEKVQQVPGGSPDMLLYGPVQFSHWHAHLPESQKQHYRCNYCNTIWSTLSCLAILHDDGSLEYPVAEAFKENVNDPVIAALLTNYPEVLDNIQNTATRRAQLMPMGFISDFFKEGTVGGFNHFYGASDSSVINAYNGSISPFADIKYVENLFLTINSKELNLPLLQKLFLYIKKEIGEKDHTALGLSNELIKLIENVRHLQETGGRGMLYLWSLLQKKSNLWMRHINGSVLGIVIDTAIELKEKDNMELALLRVKRLLATATAAENHKQKTAEASEAHLDQVFKFLAENDLKKTLERRLLPIQEVKSVIWQHKDDLREAMSKQQSESAADAAFQQLKEKKNPDAAANKKMDELLGDVVADVSMSLQGFIQNLDQYSAISISKKTSIVAPVFATSAAYEADHDKLFHFDKTVGDTAFLLSIPQPMAYSVMAGLCNAWERESVLGQHYDIPVKAIFASNRLAAEDCNYVAYVEGFGLCFQKTLSHHGSCILGSAIKSEHFGMSRAIVELSRQIPLQTEAGKDAAGGAFLIPGTILSAVRKDGTREMIQITSLK